MLPRQPIRDLAGKADRDPSAFARAARILLDDPGVGILVVGLFGGYHLRFSGSLAKEEHRAAEALWNEAKVSGKHLVVHSMYADRVPGEDGSAVLEGLRRKGVCVTGSLEACRPSGE